MSEKMLVDTTLWVQSLRKTGDPAAKELVHSLMASERAVWCDIIRLELWAGAKGHAERQWLAHLDQQIPRLPITPDVWNLAFRLVNASLKRGYTIPANDYLIFACGRHYGMAVKHLDQHYDLLALLQPED